MNKNEDYLDWLREIRRKIASECDNDSKLMGDYFRSIQRQCGKKILRESDYTDSENLLSRKSA